MALEFNNEGITVDTFQEIFDEHVLGYQEIYGNEINVDPDSPDGQRIAIESQHIIDAQSFGPWLYNAMDPDTSTGDAQIRGIKLAGIELLRGSVSQAILTVVATKDCILQVNWTAQDTLSQNWVTKFQNALTTGNNTVTVFSENEGKIEALAGTITTPITIVVGVDTITNPLDAVIGRDEETEEELRIRRNKSIESPSTSTVGAMYSELGKVFNLIDINVVENNTDSLDGANNLEAHSLWIIVTGGDSGDIAETIAKNLTGGSGLKGSTTGTFTETIVRPDDSEFDYIHEEKFDYSSASDLHVRMDASKTDPAVSVDVDGIKAKLVARSFRIGESVQAGVLYATCYSAGDTAIISELEISPDGAAWTDGIELQDADKYFTIETGNIDITVT